MKIYLENIDMIDDQIEEQIEKLVEKKVPSDFFAVGASPVQAPRGLFGAGASPPRSPPVQTHVGLSSPFLANPGLFDVVSLSRSPPVQTLEDFLVNQLHKKNNW